MKQIDIIIFDLDGTLVDSCKDIINSVNFTLKELGLDEKSPGKIKKYIGTGIEDLLMLSVGREDLYEKAHSIFKEHFTEHCLDTSGLYPGVKDVLEFFKEKTKAVVTNRKKYSADRVLEALKINGYFANVLGADDVSCMKPSSCPMDQTLLKLDIENRKRAIMVGDMDVDIESGKVSGILTCGVTYGIGDKDDIVNARPDFVIDGIERLKDIIC